MLPPFPLQTRFAEIVQQIDKGRFVMQDGLKKLELTYKALMHGLFLNKPGILVDIVD